MQWSGVILGELASKSNSRRVVRMGRGGRRRIAVIKSEKALRWVTAARWQLLSQRPARQLTGDVGVRAVIYYRTFRPDLDEACVLDSLQGVVYANDRQVREKHVRHAIDKTNPRVEVTVIEIPRSVITTKASKNRHLVVWSM